MRTALRTGGEEIGERRAKSYNDTGRPSNLRSLRERLRHSLMSKADSDERLVEQAAKGDKDSYRQLVERYQARAFSIAYEVVKSKEDAEDVVQESFVKAYMSLGQFRGHSSFYTWLYRIVYNMAIDYRRKISRRGGDALSYNELASPDEPGVAAAVADSGPDPQMQLFRKEQAKRIQDVLSSISEEHRAVLMLREIEGMNYDEISRVVGVNKGTVMSRLHYARKKLQKALGDLMYPEKPADPGEPGAIDADGAREQEKAKLSFKRM